VTKAWSDGLTIDRSTIKTIPTKVPSLILT